MGARLTSKTIKGRFFFFCLLVIIILCIIYFYLMYAQENFKNAKWAEKRCLSELSSVKYQLDVVTDYKSHVEKMLTESQKAHSMAKDKFKDVTESCVTMKQQSLLCQSQFDDLQSECKKVRETYNRDKLEVTKFKEKNEEEVKERELLQQKIHELNTVIDRLHKSNRNLQDLQQMERARENGPPSFEDEELNVANLRNFSRQIEISPGIYVVGKSAVKEAASATDKNTIHKTKDIITIQSETKDRSSDLVPPGFAPVLSVVENGDNVNLQKPPDFNVIVAANNLKNVDHNLRDTRNKNDDGDLEMVGAMPEAKDSAIVEDNEGLNGGVEEDKRPAPALGDEARQEDGVNRAAQEDDDEGEEYAA